MTTAALDVVASVGTTSWPGRLTSDDIATMFRNEMGDRVAPYLWTDSEVYPFIDEAQSQFCRKTDGISDARTPAVTQIAVMPGIEWYATHPRILNVRKVTRGDTGVTVPMLNAEETETRSLVFLPTLTSPVKALVLGFEPHVARIYPMPNETVTLNLQVYRLPLVTITDIGGQPLEIDGHHFPGLVLWMKARAYDKQDTETFDRAKADDYYARFEAYCAKAKQEQGRARRVQGNVAYGGIPIVGRSSDVAPNDYYRRF